MMKLSEKPEVVTCNLCTWHVSETRKMVFNGKTIDREGRVFQVFLCPNCLATKAFWDEEDKRFQPDTSYGLDRVG